MRNHFSKILYELIKENKKIILLSADIGNRLFDKKKKIFQKFFELWNCRIKYDYICFWIIKNGFIPICYTITNFLIYKTFEQIRNDSIYNKNKIIIVGTGSGFSYNHLGPTHHSLEDIGILNNLPDINIFSPSDNNDLKVHLNYAVKRKNHFCTYLRIGKKNEPLIKKPQSKINELNFLIKKIKKCNCIHRPIIRRSFVRIKTIRREKFKFFNN